MRILLVEDDGVLGDSLVELLQDEYYAVDWARSGGEADEMMEVNSYDAVILDWAIPPPSGIQLLSQWRDAGRTLPVLMLTGRDNLDDKVEGLDTGADDYLTKPFRLQELLARLRSLLRRRDKELDLRLEAGDVVMHRPAREVWVGERRIELTPKEFGLLEYLLRHCGQVVSRSELAEHVWDDGFDSLSNVIDVTVHRLRKKIDGGRRQPLLNTVKGVGYILRCERD